jgi:hypothetical protein
LRAIAQISGVSLTWDEQAPALRFAFPERSKALSSEAG